MTTKNVEQIFRLTPVQQGMLFHTLYAPEDDAYFDQFMVPVGDLEPTMLERAWQRLIERHAALRTCFVWRDLEHPVQVVQRKVSFNIPLTDLSALGRDERQRRLVALRAADRHGFDLTKTPLMRLRLVRFGAGDQRAVWTYHHLLLDGWSVGIILGELHSLLAAAARGRSPESVELPAVRPFRDYVRWLDAEGLDDAAEHWRQRLRGVELPTPLGIDAPVTEDSLGGSASFGQLRRRLDPELSRALDALVRARRLTLPAVLQAAWAVVLSRIAGRDDVVFGVTVSGRSRGPKGIQRMVGCFINTLPVRVRIDGSGRVCDLLVAMCDQLRALLRHEHSPLVDVRRWAGQPANAPLFESIFVYERFSAGPAVRPDEDASFQRTHYPLLVGAVPLTDRVQVFIGTDRRRITDQAARMIAHALETVLRQMVARPDARLRDLELICENQRQTLIEGFSRPSPPCLDGGTIQGLVTEQAARTPTAEAVLGADGGRLDYAGLCAEAARLAHHLHHRGAAHDQAIGICLERSPRLVIAALAVLEAGCAYLPLDPRLPPERRAFMAGDAGASLVIVDARTRALVAEDARTVDLDAECATIERRPDLPPAIAVTPDQLAYIIYTSGSTGRPKGVAVSHRAAANRLAWVRDVDARRPVRFLQKTTFAFDVSVAEIFAPLVTGGAVVLARIDGEKDPEYLVRRIAETQVTDTSFPPTLLRALLDESAFTDYHGLRSVITGGETVPPDLPGRFQAALPNARLENRYGPTETTISVTAWVCPADGPEGGRSDGSARATALPIGRPIAGAEVLVLDRELRPLPIGVTGEVMIAGVCLARGYRHRPAHTAEAFVPHPHAAEPGARLYRTGDLGHWRQDGVLMFAGRRDRQVKIRGFRVELGEIDAALASEPAVAEAATVDIPDGVSRRLVACVVPAAGREHDEESLRRALATRLPEYMVPAAFVRLDRLPTTATGKVDRQALRKTAGQAADRARGVFVAPRNDAERAIAAIWSEVLEREQVGAEDDFFDLGGHSLLATRVIGRIRKQLGVELPLRSLFESPTVARLAAFLVARQSDSGAAAEAPQNGAGTGAGTGTEPAIAVRDESAATPLSFAQERLWFIDRLEPGNPWYNVPAAVRLVGRLDLAALESGLATVIRRHESLRTVFVDRGGQPRAELRPGARLNLRVVDLSHLKDADRHATRLTAAAIAHPFDLAAGPLLRTLVIRLHDREHALVLTLHHIVADEWSMGILTREWAAAYGAHLAGRTAELAPVEVQYGDYAAWQRQRLTGERLDHEIAWWQSHLESMPRLLEIPTDRQRPRFQTYAGGTVARILDTASANSLRQLARGHDATVFMTLLAAWSAYLARLSGQSAVVVGTPIANRDRPEVEGLIGFFVNTLALAMEVGDETTFAQMVRRARDMTLGAHAHQEVPFERLVQTLAPERDLGHAPLFQTMLSMQHAATSDVRFPGLELKSQPAPTGISKFDLTLAAVDAGDRITLRLVYKTDLFATTTAERMLDQLTTLIRAAVAAPETPVSALELIDQAGRLALLAASKAPGPEASPRAQTLDALVRAQIARTPEAVALVANGASLTYAQLGQRAARLAHRLRGLGVGTETIVAVAVPRCFALIETLLAVLDAGAAFLPLAPTDPATRQCFMVRDAGARAIVTTDDLAPRFAELDSAIVTVAVTADMANPSDDRHDSKHGTLQGVDNGSDDEPPRLDRSPEAAAYVIYTSGSTGLPKGVVVSHRAVAERLAWVRTHDLDANSAFLQKTTIAFDVAVAEIFGPLVAGGKSVLVPPGKSGDTHALLALIESAGVTHTSFPPTLLTALLDEPAFARRARGLRSIITGGETVPPSLPRRLAAVPLAARIENRYGPTEATISVTAWHCDPSAEERSLPIGRPIGGAELRVLSRHFALAPVGIPGEIAIGGSAVARGYLGRPRQTASAFVPDPWSDHPGARLYLTGDLARWRGDRALEFIGRRDAQVKIRGFRVELGEVEAVLDSHPAVDQVAVVDVVDSTTTATHGATPAAGSGDRHLVAFVTAVPAGLDTDLETGLDIGALRDFAGQHLPAHQVPSAFIALDALPTTSTGKIDRRALRELGQTGRARMELAQMGLTETERAQQAAGRPPATATEVQVAAAWCALLGRDTVGADDNFFALGGHSLLATRLMARLRHTLDVDVPLRALFEAPTVAGLAAVIDTLGHARAATPPLVASHQDGPAPLSFAQERLWFLDRLSPGLPLYNIPVALRLAGPLDAAALARALTAVVTRHEALRTRFPEVAGLPVQEVVAAEDASVEHAAWRLARVELASLPAARREAEVERWAATEASRPFDLAKGPLVRATLLHLAADDHAILFTIHHIIGDEWSMGVLVGEVSACYRTATSGQQPSLPPLPVQYRDYARWQRRVLGDETLARQLAYWRAHLEDAPATLELPTDRPRPAIERHRGGLARRTLSRDLTRAIDSFARDHDATRFMVLLAVWGALLARHARQDQVVVGTPVANRGRVELENLIGFFVNTLALRLDLGDAPSLATLVARARQAVAGGTAHQDIPFERLVQVLAPERDLSRAPLFQAMLIVQQRHGSGGEGGDNSDGTLDLPGIRARAIRRPGSTAKFDLTLGVAESQGGLGLALEYNRDLFVPVTAERLLARFEKLITSALAEPERPLAALPLLDAAETATLVAVAQGRECFQCKKQGRGAPGRRQTLPALFSAQVARAPDAEAVRDTAGNSLRYRELAASAGALAARVQDRGLGPEARIGIFVERSASLVVATLGVLEAGCAYVPLDPTFPAERLADVAAEADLRLVLTEKRLADTMPTGAVPTLMIDADDAPARSKTPFQRPAIDPDHLAYVIFTSGSTGKPKGVAISHGALANFLLSMIEEPGIAAGDTLLAVTTLSFDIAALELFAPLVAGARTVIASRAETLDGPRLASLAREHAATVMQATPATWRLLLATGWQGAANLRILCGGEPLATDLAATLAASGAALWNLYGPTETTVWSTAARLGAGAPVTIGTPIAETTVYAVDTRGDLVPIGVPGELLIGGQGVGRGYLGRPALSAARFVPDPFSRHPGARLYRTGDLARWRDDGSSDGHASARLECLGRLDHQLKIRGFRIEAGEVETALSEHPAVRAAAVVAQQDPAGGKRLVAFLVTGDDLPATAALRRHVGQRLPEYMVPSRFVHLEALPLTANGKVDRVALARGTVRIQRDRQPGGQPADGTAARALPASRTQRAIAEIWCQVLELEEVGADESFFDLGGHSLMLARVHSLLREGPLPDVPMVDLFRFATVRSLATHLDAMRDTGEAAANRLTGTAIRARVRARREGSGDDAIALIAMTGRFPGAPDTDTLWQRLRAGDELLTFFDDETLRAAGVSEALLARTSYVKAAAQIADVDRFDAAFFDYSPREAQIIDPQQRVFLECAWQALEEAGYDSARYPGRIGVFGGVGLNTYLFDLLAQPALLEMIGRFQLMISNDKDFLPTRVSYKLGLTGPSINVQTACSTSLVAVALGCDALLNRNADMVLAGGVTIRPSARRPGGYLFEDGGIQSPDGHTRTFDAKSRGTVSSSSAGIVVLKRLADAIADGDAIRAVIRGWATNNDGAAKIGYTAPSVDGQAAVIAEAIAIAGVDPETIGYVEAHGTGTPLGDPIEVAALTRAFRAAGATATGYCALGSIKSNLGHTDAAAGVTGLIKTVLALEHGEIPPSLHFETPNPEIDFDSSPFRVAARARSWKTDGHPRRAGISALGIGGTNVHLVLEQAPPPRAAGAAGAWQLLVLSARTEPALDQATAQLAERLAGGLKQRDPSPDAPLADVAHTLIHGRRTFPYRRIVVARDAADAARALGDESRVRSRYQSADARPVAFLFPGGGAQYPGMGRDLYDSESRYRQEIDRCAQILSTQLDIDLRQVLFPTGSKQQAARLLRRTSFALPALFATEYALAELIRSWGIEPAALIGHSLGEYTAAVLAGVLRLEDALELVTVRGKLFETLPAGGMLSVPLGARDLEPLLTDGLAIAAHNTPELCVASGPVAAIESLAETLRERDIDSSRLHIDVAAHSPMVEAILDRFAEAASAIVTAPPKVPLVSNVTGDWLSDADAADATYWPRHLRATVRFEGGLRTLLDGERLGQAPVLLEVGPGRTLGTLARQHPMQAQAGGIETSLRHPDENVSDLRYLLDTLGRLWLDGAGIDWSRFASSDTLGPNRRRLRLPTYPFERQPCWIDRPRPESSRSRSASPRATGLDIASFSGPEAAASVANPPEAGLGHTAPRNELERRLVTLWQQLLGVARVGIHDDFFELGGSSLLAMRMRAQWSKLSGREIPVQLILEAPTIAGLATRLGSQTRSEETDAAEEVSSPTPNLVPLRAGTRSALFLVHAVGGNVFSYRPLAHALGGDYPIYGIRATGTEPDETPREDLPSMAAAYVEQIRHLQPHGPYRLAGSSLGGTVAFEMAQQLLAAGARVALVALIDAVGPDQMPPQPEDDAELLDFLLRDRLPIAVDTLRGMDTQSRLEAVVEAAHAAGALAPEIGTDGAQRLLGMAERHLRALFTYQHRTYPGRLLYFRAEVRRRWDPPNPERPWLELAEGGVAFHRIGGDHLSMNRSPHVEKIAACLDEALARPATRDDLSPLFPPGDADA